MNVSEEFCVKYNPVKGLVIFEKEIGSGLESDPEFYVESYDLGKGNKFVNAHPLSVQEMIKLSTLFQRSKEAQNGYLQCDGILPTNVLHVDNCVEGFALWYTLPQEVDLLFTDAMGISCGKAKVPALLWKATKTGLRVFAFRGNKRPNMETPLFHAPFFNTSKSGEVCMGNARILIAENATLADFMLLWERAFWNSYFSHPAGGFDALSVDIVAMWKKHIGSGKPFPIACLNKCSVHISNLIS